MRKFHKKDGLTLVEIIVSLAIIGLLSVSFLTMFTSGFDIIFSMGYKTEAIKIAQEIVDYHYDNEPITEPNGSLPTLPDTIPSRYTVTRTTTVTSDGLTQIVITVSYRNNQRSVAITALVP